MALRKLDEVIVERLRSDEEFRRAYWDEIETVLTNGETETAKSMVRCLRASYKPEKRMMQPGDGQ